MDSPPQQHLQRQAYQKAFAAYSQGDYGRAKKHLQNLLEENPQFVDAHNLLGICHLNLNDLVQAERSLRAALSISPRVDFYSNLGMILARAGDLEAAAEAYRSALALAPQAADICTNYANILSSQGKYDDAIELYRRAMSADPRYAAAYRNMTVALRAANREQEALPIYRLMGALGELQFEMRKLVNWSDLGAIDAACLQQIGEGTLQPVNPWCLLHLPGMTPELELKAAHHFALNRTSVTRAPQLCGSRRVETVSRPLRIGYLSSDFHNHATMHLLAGVLENHDHKAHSIVLFSYGPMTGDHYTKRLQATGWPRIEIGLMSDTEAAQEIFRQEIDILVDLASYTREARVDISALRPAPIIVNWLGYPGTLGHERLADYIIGDAIVTPLEDARYYSERLALMPDSYQPNDRLRPLPELPNRAAVGLPEKSLVFCSFNQATKFNPQTFDIWTRLLAAVPDSVLWLLQPKSPVAGPNIRQEIAARGVSGERVIFAPVASQADHISRLRLSDLALDTFPYTSHTTGSDALWAGVPLITMKGQTFASRVAASLLTVHGFPDLITENEDDYFNLALELATNAQRRTAVKERLERARMTSPLFDTVRFTRNLENLYRAMVDDHNTPAELRSPVVAIA